MTCFPPPERLDHWCVASGDNEAMVSNHDRRAAEWRPVVTALLVDPV